MADPNVEQEAAKLLDNVGDEELLVLKSRSLTENNCKLANRQAQRIGMEGNCKTTDVNLCDANLCVSMPTSEYATATDSAPDSIRTEVGLESTSGCEPFASDSGSSRIERLMLGRSEFATAVEFEIETSKCHWSELDEWSSSDEEQETNFEVFQRLKQKWGGFFQDYGDSLVLGEKIAEGGQAEIFNAKYAYPDSTYKEETVVKVFKHGCALRKLEKQWPLGMLGNQRQGGWYWDANSCLIWGATLLQNGRFAFRMKKHWGDLRTLIDFRMQHNYNKLPRWKQLRAFLMQRKYNQFPPFTTSEEGHILLSIAQGVLELHEQNIIHRDLKASNVLLDTHLAENINTFDCFDPVHDKFDCVVADFECSVGVVGTGYWRAPEILQALQKRDDKSHLFTKKADVYSYAMTCYEVLTGHVPFEDLGQGGHNIVIEGQRPQLPQHVDPLLKALLTRCWQKNPSERPSFEEIQECLKKIYGMQSSDDEAFDDDLSFPDEASDDEALIFPG